MGNFERFLTVWMGLGILTGVALGLLSRGACQAISALGALLCRYLFGLWIDPQSANGYIAGMILCRATAFLPLPGGAHAGCGCRARWPDQTV